LRGKSHERPACERASSACLSHTKAESTSQPCKFSKLGVALPWLSPRDRPPHLHSPGSHSCPFTPFALLPPPFAAFDDLYSFDPGNMAWTKLVTSGQRPTPRSYFGFTSAGGALYLHGGLGVGLSYMRPKPHRPTVSSFYFEAPSLPLVLYVRRHIGL
jgi:hypothetical protein